MEHDAKQRESPAKNSKKSENMGGDILIYPNPNNGVFNLTINSDIKGKMDIRIFDFTGKELKRIELAKDIYMLSFLIELTDAAIGTYFIEVRNDNVVLKRKTFIII